MLTSTKKILSNLTTFISQVMSKIFPRDAFNRIVLASHATMGTYIKKRPHVATKLSR